MIEHGFQKTWVLQTIVL